MRSGEDESCSLVGIMGSGRTVSYIANDDSVRVAPSRRPFLSAPQGCKLLGIMQTADVVLIGGGIVASSIAYHLTAAGCHNVLVVERESAQGKGSTGKSMGG